MKKKLFLITAAVLFLLVSCKTENKPVPDKEISAEIKDPLPSWNDTQNKQAIIAFITNAIDENNANFIPVSERIATFDNDGTLWTEQPIYFQFFFAVDRIKTLSSEHPEWKTKMPYKAILENDMEAFMKTGMKGIAEVLMASHVGNTTEEFNGFVKEWAKTAKHPTKNVPFTDLVYQPMLELLTYLRANDFKTYIVSGGGIDFMRALVTEVYGIPSEQIIGSTVKTEFDYNNGNPVMRRLAELDFNDDKEGKPVNINKFIGKKPVFAAGNSDGDLQMLQWAASNKYKSLMLYVHHTDSIREWAYDRDSHIGKFDKGLDQAKADNWTLVDMKNDWKIIYPFELK
jgi:phosphoglycolate phosphatase-like HAD superfamily hydrolase